MEGTRLEVAGREAQLEAGDLERLTKPLLRLERIRANLKRKGLSFDEYLREEDEGAFPEWHVSAMGEEKYFFDEAEAEKFREEKLRLLAEQMAANGENGNGGPKRAAKASSDTQTEIAADEVDAEALAAEGDKGQATLAASGMGLEMRHLNEAQALTESFSDLASLGFARADYTDTTSADTGYKFRVLESNQTEHGAASLAEVLDKIRDLGKKGMDVQRYKGLGEMNDEQLWETTMDPKQRVLLRVKLEDALAADDMFKILMGEGVAARREFIEQHALEITDLDV